MSQAKLAKLVGVNAATICNIETGKQSPAAATIVKLARALNASPNDVLGFEEAAK